MSNMMPYRGRGFDLERSNPFGGWLDDSFFRPLFAWNDMANTMSAFKVDIKDRGKDYVIEAELPGIPQDQIALTVDNGVLTISADTTGEQKQERENYVYSERRSGHFSRSFNLEGIREEQISAAYENGILCVTLPKVMGGEEKKARRIDIR